MLTADQRRTLRRLASAPSPRVARRAELVLAQGTDRISAKWRRRFLAQGEAGLYDTARSGRPASHDDEVRRRILTEPLFTPAPKWTSRTIADAVGVSQSTVVRLWAEVFDPGLLRDAADWARWRHSCRPTGLLVGGGTAVLVLERIRDRRTSAWSAAEQPAFSMRAPVRAPLQTVLAAERLPTTGANPPDEHAFLAAARADPAAQYVVIGADGDVRVPPEDWQALLSHVGASLSPAATPVVEELAHRVREWAVDPAVPLRWVSPEAPHRTKEPAYAPGLSASQRLAESLAAAIQEGVSAGRLRGGERVTESFLMRATHASRSQVRDALRSLAADGLVELQAGRGAVVPTPNVDDVLETYALRQSLGLLIVASASNWRPGALDPVTRTYEDLRKVARIGDGAATRDADLDFQDALALAADLRRVPTMFRRMTIQLRLFISVMGLEYAYSVPEIVADDAAILAAVRHRDAAAAERLWKRKMDAAAAYMVRQAERIR